MAALKIINRIKNIFRANFLNFAKAKLLSELDLDKGFSGGAVIVKLDPQINRRLEIIYLVSNRPDKVIAKLSDNTGFKHIESDIDINKFNDNLKRFRLLVSQAKQEGAFIKGGSNLIFAYKDDASIKSYDLKYNALNVEGKSFVDSLFEWKDIREM